MFYPFVCSNKDCNNESNEMMTVSDYEQLDKDEKGNTVIKCPLCESNMQRSYTDFRIRKFKGKITPREVRTADGQVHKLSDNLYRN